MRAATQLFSVFLAGIIVGTASPAAEDPFVGKWVSNPQKSPLPTITYKIRDLGGGRLALTGSTGETTELKADGVALDSPSGGKVSLKKVGERDWLLTRTSPPMSRTYTISPDDKTLTLTDTYTNKDGTTEKTEFAYARTSPGKGFIGEWRSVRSKRLTSEKGRETIIEPYGKDGLSFVSPSDNTRLDLNFDGKPYALKGEGVRKGLTTRGTRVNAHLLRTENWANGKIVERDEFRLSDGGKTLTIEARPANSPAVFTDVLDKH